MRAFLQDLYDRVPFSIDQVTSRADWKRWREETSAALKRALGLERFPPRSPLKPRFLETIDRGDFLLEKVVFETRPGFLMTANLYRPKEVEGKVPAVLCVHGHTMKGKASEAMQARATNYARAGWLALTVDATGHGERVPIGHRRTFSIVTVGLTLEGVQVWDNIRAVDFLISQAEVDPKRIGITGCSGGGNQTMYTAAVDERIAAAVPVCSVSTLRGQIFTPNGIGCQCECVPDLMRYGLENAVVCALIAPRPLLVLAGTRDAVFPVRYTREANRHLERFYRAIGCPERYAYIERRLPHGYQRPFRQLAHAWFDRWFNRRRRMLPWREKGPAPLPEKKVWCFPDGRLPAGTADLGSLSWEAARREAARLKVPAAPAARKRLRRRIRDDVLGGFPTPPPLDLQQTRPLTRNGLKRWRMTFTAEKGVRLEARLTVPVGGTGRLPWLVRVRETPGGRRRDEAEHLLRRRAALVEFSTRPLGDEHVARAALVLGRPLVGMAACDLSRLVDCLEGLGGVEGVDPGRVFLWAEGCISLPALYAAALDERIAGATLSGLLATYVSYQPIQHPTWTFARGLLRCADIDHLLALVAPRPLVVADPVGPDLKPLDPRRLRRSFPAARKAYGRGGKFRVVSTAGREEREEPVRLLLELARRRQRGK